MTDRTGYVYAVTIAGSPLVKIGRARSVEKRLRALQTGMPHRLTLLHIRCADEAPAVEQA